MAAQAVPIGGPNEERGTGGERTPLHRRLALFGGRTSVQADLRNRRGLPQPGAHRWLPGELLAMARHGCMVCLGTGARPGWGGHPRACRCVYRRAFRACLKEYRICREGATKWQVTYEKWMDSDGRTTANYGLPREEFVADFELLAKRALTAAQQRILKLHIVGEVDSKVCVRLLGMDRGAFFHEVYRIQETLGWVFSELKPHPLFPVSQYFRSGGVKMQVKSERNPWPWAA